MGRKPLDLTGKRFGKLVAIEIAEHCGSHKPTKWLCKCDCGEQKIVDSQCLTRGIITDCGCKVRNRLCGKRFGRLLVLEPTDRRDKHCGHIIWKCLCDCGNITYATTGNLTAKNNFTASCGCMRREKHTTHNMSKTSIYKAYTAMKQRCNNPKNQNYFRYGGRGIKVCEEWNGENGFENFYNWAMGHGYKEGLTIDRIDNDDGYSPDNCRWVTQLVQMNNHRRNRYITVDGKKKTISQWARELNASQGMIHWRLQNGWGEKEAVTTPSTRKRMG